MPMDMHYCEIFSDCYRCPCPFCPYEKLEDGTDWMTDGAEEADEQEEQDEDEGW